jgi:DNA-binding LacI/PurR family transcriptional regulator
MAEVARLAGVLSTTVSHVLNKTRNVAPETEQLVIATAVDLLLAGMKTPDRPPQSVAVPTEFHHRDSYGCGRRKPRVA